MHVVFRESHGLEESETPVDLGQDPADLVVMSFSDSDLGAFAAGWHRAKGTLPALRLANLVALRHPLSIDTYIERTLCGARAVLIRLIGGEAYWPYGLSEVGRIARERGLALAVLPADGFEDARLDACSTLPVSTLRRLSALCDAGGAVAAQAALAQLALAAGLYAGPVPGGKTVPEHGFYDPELGIIPELPNTALPGIIVPFYRSYLTAADTAPVDALIAALRARGFATHGAFVPSLKAPQSAEWLRDQLAKTAPAAIVNVTAFSAEGADGQPSPLDAPGCPVFQVALSTARRRDWASSARGLSPADLAMHVVLPEIDGRVFAGVASFKSPGKRDPDLQYSRFAHRADTGRIEAIADRVVAWHRLAITPAAERKLAIVLSTYPGKAHQIAHAVGLDAMASTEVILAMLAAGRQDAEAVTGLGTALLTDVIEWPLDAYRKALAQLPEPLRQALDDAWGAPEDDPAVVGDAFRFSALRRDGTIIALQPERGEAPSRADEYHDLARVPRHGYVAFYLWLRRMGLHALVHVGAHGTLEWLPGKAVALSEACWPDALIGALPVIYPFIVNDPGEAAQARRRIGAVTLGHLPPPLAESRLPANLERLERLLDEYSTADGLDPARRGRLIAAIREEAASAGVEADLGLRPETSAAEALTSIDRFVCDIKESQFAEGLHVFGTGTCGAEELAGLRTALAGRRVPAGPAGSPWRGRSDVLPTGRNLFSVDPRAVPSRVAHAQGVKLAEELVRRHLQDHGDYPRALVVDLWGSATMRTAGEEFAMAMHLAGLAPRWDSGSGRVSGFDILPPAVLGRPRIDVTLRLSGLFRDTFAGLAQLFEAGTEALATRDQEDGNPYLARASRVFGPKPGQYGLGMGSLLGDFTPEARVRAGEAWLSASEWAIDPTGEMRRDRAGIEARVRLADGFVHVQDLAETDLIMAADYPAHEAGFAAAARLLGGTAPALYHLDTTRPDAPRARLLPEEIARVVRTRAANPDWVSSMMRHGFRGAAEIAATLDHMAAFAHLAEAVPAHLFDLLHGATLSTPEVHAFLQRENPLALEAMEDCFRRLRDAGLWITRRNSIVAAMAAVP